MSLLRRSVLAALVGLSACAPSSTPVATEPPAPASTAADPTPAPTDGADIASIHKARCGKCHVRVEPGARSRDALTRALARHRKRVHLTEPQWGALIDYLAPAPPAAPAAPTSPG